MDGQRIVAVSLLALLVLAAFLFLLLRERERVEGSLLLGGDEFAHNFKKRRGRIERGEFVFDMQPSWNPGGFVQNYCIGARTTCRSAPLAVFCVDTGSGYLTTQKKCSVCIPFHGKVAISYKQGELNGCVSSLGLRFPDDGYAAAEQTVRLFSIAHARWSGVRADQKMDIWGMAPRGSLLGHPCLVEQLGIRSALFLFRGPLATKRLVLSANPGGPRYASHFMPANAQYSPLMKSLPWCDYLSVPVTKIVLRTTVPAAGKTDGSTLTAVLSSQTEGGTFPLVVDTGTSAPLTLLNETGRHAARLVMDGGIVPPSRLFVTHATVSLCTGMVLRVQIEDPFRTLSVPEGGFVDAVLLGIQALHHLNFLVQYSQGRIFFWE